jgi:hypothetical protein
MPAASCGSISRTKGRTKDLNTLKSMGYASPRQMDRFEACERGVTKIGPFVWGDRTSEVSRAEGHHGEEEGEHP